MLISIISWIEILIFNTLMLGIFKIILQKD